MVVLIDIQIPPPLFLDVGQPQEVVALSQLRAGAGHPRVPRPGCRSPFQRLDAQVAQQMIAPVILAIGRHGCQTNTART